MGPAFVCLLQKSSSPSLSASPAERVLCLGETLVSDLPGVSWGGWTAMYCCALWCNRLPMFMLFCSLRCVLWVPSLLPFILSQMHPTNGVTYEALYQAVFFQPNFTSCFVQMLCSAHCCNSLPDVSTDLFFLRRNRHKALHIYIYIYILIY